MSRQDIEDESSKPQDGGERSDTAAEALIGTTFAGKYEIQSVLGTGGMSIVYKARHMYMNRIVAVKLLLEHLVNDTIALERFRKESEAAASLGHQNIVNVFDFGITENKQAYFVMDCLEGDSLQDLIFQFGGMSPERAVNIFRQICDGLAHAHKKGVVHRDLKPSNIVIVKEEDGSDLAKIVDFGLAKVHKAQTPDEARLTQSGMVFGSPLYMSPEQCQGYPLDARSDIYSMGCLMFETLSGNTPFHADSFFNMALMHIHQAPPHFESVAPDRKVPKELEDVIMKCLAKDPDARFQTVEDLRQKILDAALIGGVSGLKAGAVPVSDTGQKSALRSTFDSMRAVVVGAHQDGMKKSSTKRIVGIATAVGIVMAFFAWIFTTSGVEGDAGSPIDKLRWQGNLFVAQMFTNNGDYPKAIHHFEEAANIASQFGDKKNRLRVTLEQEADAYKKWGKYEESEQTNKRVGDILTEQILAEAEDIRTTMRDLAQDTNTQSKKEANKLAAVANTPRLTTSGKRLNSRGLYKQEESVLSVGINSLNKLGLGDTLGMAEAKSLMADALIGQQRLDEARTYLVSAYEIRKKNSDTSPKAQRELLKAQLRLGQFDRDQSNFKEAEVELSSAMRTIEEKFPSDAQLMSEAKNSYADLQRQIKKHDELDHR